MIYITKRGGVRPRPLHMGPPVENDFDCVKFRLSFAMENHFIIKQSMQFIVEVEANDKLSFLSVMY